MRSPAFTGFISDKNRHLKIKFNYNEFFIICESYELILMSHYIEKNRTFI